MVLKIILGIFVAAILIIALCLFVSYLREKYAVWLEYKGTVVNISNCTMIINCFDPGMYAVVLVEDQDKLMHQYITNLSLSDRLVIGQEYKFIECDGVLVDIVASN